MRQQIRRCTCPEPGAQRALLDVAASVLTERLSWSRPLWTATFVSGLAGGGTGLVLVMNHVLAGGVGGLAVLARLADEMSAVAPPALSAARFPVPAPDHAGTLRITVASDPGRVPDVLVLTAALRDDLGMRRAESQQPDRRLRRFVAAPRPARRRAAAR